jgi:pyruvate/2-oxoglutarate/acetoin dehydrogenase E1 component
MINGSSERVVENLNRAIHQLMRSDNRVIMLGEDLLDPYGGAFKVARGLSTAFPDRVISTPISELGITGVANGLALAGQRPIVEFMFGDFIFLAFDQIVNFAAKSVSMYGERVAHHLLVRCPTGGHRGYGATHSQSVQKHFLGVPNLELFELSPLHDNREMLPQILDRGNPGILFESKILYAQPQLQEGPIDDLFAFDFLDEERLVARAFIDENPEILIITPGGTFSACHQAARLLLLDFEIEAQIVVPFQLYPFRFEPIRDLASSVRSIYVVEEGTAGGTWGAEVASVFARALPSLRAPIRLIHSADSIIPSSRHLEREVLVQPQTIVDCIRADFHAANHRPDHQ